MVGRLRRRLSILLAAGSRPSDPAVRNRAAAGPGTRPARTAEDRSGAAEPGRRARNPHLSDPRRLPRVRRRPFRVVLRSAARPRARPRYLGPRRRRHRERRPPRPGRRVPGARGDRRVSRPGRTRKAARPGDRGGQPGGDLSRGAMTPYHDFVAALAGLVRDGKNLPLGTFPAPDRAAPAAGAPAALIFSPHPDDECIIGALAVRLQREGGYRVVNVAVTQGSNKARQAGRWVELRAACDYLGFELVETVPGGLEKISAATRQNDQARWQAGVDVIAEILRTRRPEVIFFPHESDWNST